MAMFSRNVTPICVLLVVGLLIPGSSLHAQAQLARGPAVVELFTSQGCSSCPPADEVLGELSTIPNVIALAFHIDYWNDLGWRDPFSMSIATARQNHYVQALGLASAFTPQAVIDGRESILGSDKRRILSAMAEKTGETVPVSLSVADGMLAVVLPVRKERIACTVFIAAYLAHASTHVARGENSGRTLEEYNLVRQFYAIGTWRGDAAVFKTALQSFPADASQVAVLVQRDGPGSIVGSAVITLR